MKLLWTIKQKIAFLLHLHMERDKESRSAHVLEPFFNWFGNAKKWQYSNGHLITPYYIRSTLIWRHDGRIRKECNCRSGLMMVLLAGTSEASLLLHSAYCTPARRCHGDVVCIPITRVSSVLATSLLLFQGANVCLYLTRKNFICPNLMASQI